MGDIVKISNYAGNKPNNKPTLSERFEQIDSEAVARAKAMLMDDSDEIAGVNHSFTKEQDIDELIKHQELVDELRSKIESNPEYQFD